MRTHRRIGIVAAMAGELKPFVEQAGLKPVRRGQFNVFESDRYVAAHAGIGRECVLDACAAVCAPGDISQLISVGWCGALDARIGAPSVQRVGAVVDGETGERFADIEQGHTLVTVSRVMGAVEKRELRRRFGAELVDMEAAHVARFARDRRLRFRAIKAVSDAHDAALPDLQRFTRADGGFQTAEFVVWMAVRPQWWAAVWRMGKNAGASARGLSVELQKLGGELQDV